MTDPSNDQISTQETGGSSKPDSNGGINTVEVKSGKCTRTSKTICLWFWVVVLVLLLIVGLVLMVVKYVFFIDAVCHPLNSAIGSSTNGSIVSSNSNSAGDRLFYVNDNKVESGSYMHVMLIIFSAFISFIRIPEYIALAWGTHKFILHELRRGLPVPPTARCCGCNCVTLYTVGVVLCLIVLGGVVFTFALKMELDEEPCEGDNNYGNMLSVVYIAHCGLDFFCTLLACFVRVWMIIHTYKVKEIWSPSDKVNCVDRLHSYGLKLFGPKKQLTDEATYEQLTDEATWEDLGAEATDEQLTAEDIVKKLAAGEQSAEITNIFKTAQELAEYAYLHEYEFKYKNKGEHAKEQMLPFVPWFLFPWLHFLVLTVINPHLLLTPWTHDYNQHRLEVIARSRFLYLGIVIVYFVQILIQIVCAMQMNQYHKDYHRDMERSVVYKYGYRTNHSSKGFYSFKKKYIYIASQMSMKFKDKYNFYPTFLCFFPNVNLENPYYWLVLVVGIAVSLSKFLYK